MNVGDKTTSRVLPAKCSQCDKPMSTPLVCDYCHALSSSAEVADYFTLLSLPRRFDVAQEPLRQKYLALSRHAHPDFHGADSPEVQQFHLRVSANLNNAYRTLSDPADRAAYLLKLLGGKTSAQDKSVPDGFLGTMMMMQEELADAREHDDTAELDRLRTVLTRQHKGLLNRVELLFAEYQDAVACEAVRAGLLDEIRKQLNAVSYVRKLLSFL